MKAFNFHDLGFMGRIAAGGSVSPMVPLTGMAWWFDASKITSLADGDPISTWNDMSGNSNHATKGAGLDARRPIYKTNIVNGLPVVRFNPGATTQYFDVPAALIAATAGELIVVARSSADPVASAADVGAWTFCGAGAGAGIGDNAWPFTANGVYENFGVVTSNTRHTAMAKTPNLAIGFHTHNVRVQTGQYLIRIDGEIIHCDDTVTCGFNSTQHYIGRGTDVGSTFWKGDIAEIMAWSRQLTIAERKDVHDYLAAKYALTLSNVATSYTPQSFSNLVGWWRTSSLAGTSDGTAIGSWADSSGTGNTITQGTGAAQPIYKAAVFGKNGTKPAVRFTTLQSLVLAADLSLPAGALTIIIVGSYTADCSPLQHPTENHQTRCRRGGINQQGMFFNSVGAEAVSVTFPRAVGEGHMAVWRRNSGNQYNLFMQNGDQPTAAGGTPGSNVASGVFKMKSLGGGVNGINLAGDIAEVAIYSGTFLADLDIWNLYDMYYRSLYDLP